MLRRCVPRLLPSPASSSSTSRSCSPDRTAHGSSPTSARASSRSSGRPGGDDMRKGHLQLEPGRDDQSTYFTRINVGKESLGLDPGRTESRGILLDLARVADVAVENFAPGVAARLGCDYSTLVIARPDLVYCSISGFGQTG